MHRSLGFTKVSTSETAMPTMAPKSDPEAGLRPDSGPSQNSAKGFAGIRLAVGWLPSTHPGYNPPPPSLSPERCIQKEQKNQPICYVAQVEHDAQLSQGRGPFGASRLQAGLAVAANTN